MAAVEIGSDVYMVEAIQNREVFLTGKGKSYIHSDGVVFNKSFGNRVFVRFQVPGRGYFIATVGIKHGG